MRRDAYRDVGGRPRLERAVEGRRPVAARCMHHSTLAFIPANYISYTYNTFTSLHHSTPAVIPAKAGIQWFYDIVKHIALFPKPLILIAT